MSSRRLLELAAGPALLAALSGAPSLAAHDPAAVVRTRAAPDSESAGLKQHLSLRSSLRSMEGRFDPYGAYAAHSESGSMVLLVSSYRVSWDFGEVWSIGTGVQASRSQGELGGRRFSGHAFGSPSVTLRRQMPVIPGFSLSLGAGFPWKIQSKSSEGSSQAGSDEDSGDSGGSGQGGSGGGDSMGGGYSLRAGASYSRTLGPVRLSFDGSVTRAFAQDTVPSDAPPGSPSVSQRRGERFQLSQSASYRLARSWSVVGGLRQSWGLKTRVNGEPAEGTASRRLSSSLGVRYSIRPGWDVSAAYETQFPFYSHLVNASYSPAFTLATSYGM